MSNIWSSWFGRLTSPFPQLSNDIRDSDLLQELHAHLKNHVQQAAKKPDDIHEEMKNVGEDVKDMRKDIKNVRKDI